MQVLAGGGFSSPWLAGWSFMTKIQAEVHPFGDFSLAHGSANEPFP
jgi:hypothetical protein